MRKEPPPVTSKMRVAYVQTSPRLGMTRVNLEEAHSLIEKVSDADLVVLPELFHSGYAVRDKAEAESLAISDDAGSETLSMCLDACRKFRMELVAGILERSGKILYNSAWHINSNGVAGVYRKNHLFNLEKNIFEPGNDISPITNAGKARIGMQVCFDWAFPEMWGRLAWGDNGRNGVHIIAHPSNLVLPDACPLAVRTRALENRIFIITAGRVGVDPGPDGEIEFRAGSRIIAPDGSVLAAGHECNPECDMVTIDHEWAEDKFATPRNHVLNERFMAEVENVERENILQ